MRVSIREKSAFESVNPVNVAAYLHSTGWSQVRDGPNGSTIWEKDYHGETADLLLPVDRSIGDYLLRMAEAVKMIAAIEERSELETLLDLQTAGSDIVRVRFRYANSADGLIPLEQGEKLIEGVRELLLAAGLAANSRRSFYASHRPEEVRQFVRNLRLGQSERGSYVLTILSNVSPQLKMNVEAVLEEPEPPFERKAIIQLNLALTALRDAIGQATTNPRADVFQKAVQQGVSANLCSALVHMSGISSQPTDEIGFSFTWARTRTRPITESKSSHQEIIFPTNDIPMIAEAARVLKAVAPSEEQEIQGFVTKLQSTDDGGIATVSTYIDGQPRKVTVVLNDSDHKKAIQAYEQRSEIVCQGTLAKSGQLWFLQNHGSLVILEEEVSTS